MGIDIGTSGTTTLIIDETGEVLSRGIVKYSCFFKEHNIVEQDLNVLWQKVAKSISISLNNLHTPSKTIDAISIASQRGTFIVADRNGNPITNAIVWSDRRAVKETALIINEFGNNLYYDKVGAFPNVLWSASKIMSFEKQNPNKYLYLNELEWIANKLGCPDFITSPSVLTQNGMMDINNFDWNKDIIDFMNISQDQLPKLKPSTTFVGTVSKEASLITGLKEGCPIYLGGGDQQMASIGTGSIFEDDIHLSLGTGGTLLSHEKTFPKINKNLIIGSYVFDKVWTKEAIILSAGNNYNWIRKILNVKSIDEMNNIAKKSVFGANGVLFMPFLSGDMGTIEDSEKTASFLFLNKNTTKVDLIRATMEGVANEIAIKLQYFNTSKKSIKVTGDCFKSDLWSQIIADQIQKELIIFEEKEATALGAAITAGVSAKIFSSFESACILCVKEKKRISYNINNVEKSKTLFEKFYKSYINTKNIEN